MLSSSGWQPLGEINYRKWIVYDFENPLPYFKDDACVCCVNAGAVALITPTHVDIFTLAGVPVGSVNLLQDLSLAKNGVFWLPSELLVLIYTSGLMQVYNYTAELLLEMNILEHDTLTGSFHDPGDTVAMACTAMEGFVLLMTSGKLLLVSEVEPKKKVQPITTSTLAQGLSVLQEQGNQASPTALATGDDFVFVGFQNGDVAVVTEFSCTRHSPESLTGGVVSLKVAPNHRFIACFAAGGLLAVYDLQFTKKILELDTQSQVAPQSMCWCGEDSVVVYWRNLGLLMVGPYGDWLKYTYVDDVAIHQEVDSLRVITASKVEMLQRVPPDTDAICRIGSFAPAAMLLDAFEAYSAGDPKATENINAIREEGTLAEAVSGCIVASRTEFEIQTQKLLLQVAGFGKLFCEDNDTLAKLSKMLRSGCMKLRVLNVLRHESVGMPMTMKQLEQLTAKSLVLRIIARNQHFLAIQVCRHLKLPLAIMQTIVEDWACKKILAVVTRRKYATGFLTPESKDDVVPDLDKSLFKSITPKLRSVVGVSYAKVALVANRSGLTQLAKMVLKDESAVLRKILVLVEIGDWSSALRSAHFSNDASLMFYCIYRLWKDGEDFYPRIRQFPDLCQLFLFYAREYDMQLLKQSYFQLGRLHEAALLSVREGLSMSHDQAQVDKLEVAFQMYKNNKAYSFQEQMVKFQIDLVRKQVELEGISGQELFLGMSLVDTIHRCLTLGMQDQADSLKRYFKMSDKQFWFVKLRALVEVGNWSELKTFAQQKKSPIGYVPFALACVKQQKHEDAVFYLNLISGDEERLQVLVELERWEAATELAIKLEDFAVAASIQSKCKNEIVLARIRENF